MPPKKAKVNTSNITTNDNIPNMPPPQSKAVETNTPPASPSKRPAMMTQAQKQALMDNLQAEITERARRLRAQYAQQAQTLRSRVELRVNRIPPNMRKRKMQDLLDEHNERARPAPAPAVPVQDEEESEPPAQPNSPRKSLKRQSDQMSTDKENAEPLPKLKKRAKPNVPPTTATTTTAAAPNTKASRTNTATTRKPTTILSPKSHNPRALPRPSPEKSTTAAATGKRVPGRAQTKRGAVAATNTAAAESGTEKENGRSSGASDSSAGTTVVTKKAAPPTTAVSKGGKAAAGARKVVGAVAKAATATAGGRKAAAAKKENAPPTATAAGGRSLRKRG